MGRPELGFLVLMTALAGGVWAFVELADEVLEGETRAFDTWLLLEMREPENPSDPVGPPWIEEMARDLTALGGTAVLTLVTLTVGGYLLLERKPRLVAFLLAAVVGGVLVSTTLKSGFERPRPDLVPHHSHVYQASFPSGHSMMAAVTWLTLAALLARVHAGAAIKIYLLGVALLVTLAVGVSRIYVGVHWPTDVLAGWTAGGVWALLCWLGARWLQRHGRIEPEPS